MDDINKRSIYALLMFLILATVPIFGHIEQIWLSQDTDNVLESPARAQTTWSGVVELSESYSVNVTDELVIAPCTVVKLSASNRIFVEGRIIISGTANCPVILSKLNNGLHFGIQFNTSSATRGSTIDNLTIEESTYGITIYGSDPILTNISIINPSRVGVDLFANAYPKIYDLYIDQAGREVSFLDWRYGIGLSVGSGSTPIVEGVVMTDLRVRGLNIWGSSGGIYRNITIDNVTAEGATVISAGVWVEDSQPLITDVSIDKADFGVLVRHIDDGGYTRAVVRDCLVSNSMYRGIYVDKANHTNYTNYETAEFVNTTVSGTGTAGAKTANVGYAAIEVNATGAWFENTLVDQSTTVGVRLYFVDYTTTFRNLTIRDSGDPGQGNHEAGLAIRSSFFAPNFAGLEISGSVGPAVSATSGGAMQGNDWFLHNNSKDGIYVDSATIIVDDIHLSDNGHSGAHIYDSRYVTLSNLTAHSNGHLGLSDGEKAGLFFEKSNDIESNSGDITCNYCNVSFSAGSGVIAKDSVDLWLNNLNIENNNPTFDPVYLDNSGLTLNQQGGTVNMHNVSIDTERIGSNAGPALNINRAAANIDLVTMRGNHSGIFWNADNNGNYASSINRAQFSGDSCLVLSDHGYLTGSNNVITSECKGSIVLQNSNVNWTNLTDLTSSAPINLDSLSSLHLHKPNQIELSNAIIAPSARIDVAWDITVWVQNNNSNGVPQALVELSFDQFEPKVEHNTNAYGYTLFSNYIGQRWSQSGPSAFSTVVVNCSYDDTSNSTSLQLDNDKIVYCSLPLGNQAPFLIWDIPEDDSVYPSGSEINFNASQSWDLDDDLLSWEWTSSIDGLIGTSDNFTVNLPGVEQILSDGVHSITAKLCDDSGHCVQEIRTVELSNLAPVVYRDIKPELNSYNELIMPRTGTVSVNLTGTYDPEGDQLNCWLQTSYGLVYPPQDAAFPSCPELIEYTFPMDSTGGEPAPPSNAFTLSILVDDGVNEPVEISYTTELYNEVPEPQFTIIRTANYSENIVTLDGSMTNDPEGDNLAIEFYSNLDGLLQWSNQQEGKVWQGHLSRGVHQIEMRVTDDSIENIGREKISSKLIVVLNSVPSAEISSPSQATTYDSSQEVIFSANGSGDFDSVCSSFNEVGYWHCSQIEASLGSEYLQVSWNSNIDGRISSTNQEGLFYQSRLTHGQHTITLEIDDGINPPVADTTTVTVTKSAPVLYLSEPNFDLVYPSSQKVLWNAMASVDYDDDQFSMTIISDLMAQPLFTNVSTDEILTSQLVAGTHQIQVSLQDSDGMIRTETFVLTIAESPPTAVVISPFEGQSFMGGEAILLAEESFDIDGDIAFRQWQIIDKLSGEILHTFTSSSANLTLSPGDYQVTLTIEDSLQNSVSEVRHIRVENTDPVLDASTLVVSPVELTVGVLTNIAVEVRLFDSDGTTNDVRANLIHGVQSWEFILEDFDGDGIWRGSVQVNAEASGRPSLKIIATDPAGDSIKVSEISKTIVVKDAESVNSRIPLIVISGGSILVFVLLTVVMIRIKKRRFANEYIASWDVVKQPSDNTDETIFDDAENPISVNDTWARLEQEEGL